MTQLIQMRSRIKAIDTIAKITHAMQLIAMADHIRLRDRKTNFERYQQAVTELFHTLNAHKPIPPATEPEKKAPEKILLIVMGSQKGLCGSFNTNVLYEAERLLKTEPYEQADLIVCGRKLKDYLTSFRQSLPFPTKVVAEHNNFVWAKMSPIARAILDHALDPALGYTKVVLYGLKPAGFFSQKIGATQLIPVGEDISSAHVPAEFSNNTVQEGIEQDPKVVCEAVEQLYLLSTIEFTILQSLMAEQASRFVSMDAATRNTKKLRENMKTQLNKLRQAKITKELTELASGL